MQRPASCPRSSGSQSLRNEAGAEVDEASGCRRHPCRGAACSPGPPDWSARRRWRPARHSPRKPQARHAGERHHQPAAAMGAGTTRRSIPTPMSSSSTRPFCRCGGRRARSTGCGPARNGPRGRPGRARATISSSATSRATCNTATSGMTAGSRAFRRPSYNSNGNSFDFQGRQLSTRGFQPPRGALGA